MTTKGSQTETRGGTPTIRGRQMKTGGRHVEERTKGREGKTMVFRAVCCFHHVSDLQAEGRQPVAATDLSASAPSSGTTSAKASVQPPLFLAQCSQVHNKLTDFMCT